jgi:hypothetical protein
MNGQQAGRMLLLRQVLTADNRALIQQESQERDSEIRESQNDHVLKLLFRVG